MAKRKGILFIISSPSGGGKTTLCEMLVKNMPRLVRSVSVTTRSLRSGEKNGRDYIFLTKKVFEKQRKDGQLLEWAKNFGYYYGTPKDNVIKLLNRGIDVILAIDVKGAMKIKKVFPRGVFVFIMPPSIDELRKRLKGRGTDGLDEIAKRIKVAQKEMSYLPAYDYAIVNDNVRKALTELKTVIKIERRKARG